VVVKCLVCVCVCVFVCVCVCVCVSVCVCVCVCVFEWHLLRSCCKKCLGLLLRLGACLLMQDSLVIKRKVIENVCMCGSDSPNKKICN
jgi:hypothetical protein